MREAADHSGPIGPVGNELQRGRSELTMHSRKTLIPSAFLAATLMFGVSPALSAATEFVVPTGPLITLQNGQTIDGHIIRIDQTNIVIQTKDGASQILPRSTVQTVAFKTVTGQELAGELVGWKPGVYQIATSEAALNIYSMMPATASPTEPQVALDIREEAPPETAPAGGPGSGRWGRQRKMRYRAARRPSPPWRSTIRPLTGSMSGAPAG